MPRLRNRMLLSATLAVAVVGALFVSVGPAMADPPVQCNGTLPPGVYGMVIVPSGASCELDNSTVTGDVIAQDGAVFLNAINDNIEGSYIAHSGYAGLCCSTVGKNVTITNTTSATQIYGSTVKGNADMVNSGGAYAVINFNTFLKNVNFTNNVSVYNDVDNNTVRHNLICENNSPPPTSVANIVGGNENGQCTG